MDGWIKLYRQLQECPIWYGERFSKGQAWVDLLILANHSDKKIMFNGDFITVKRGQYLTSMVKLSEKWKWNRKTVSSFLKLLENDNMISKVSDNTKTLVTIVNYGIYQSDDEGLGQPIDQPNGQPIGQQRVSPTDNPLDTNKNDKNVKNEEEREELYTDCSVFSVSDKSDTPKTTQSVRQTEVRRAVEAWNNLAGHGIPQVSKMASTSRRYQMLSARIAQYGIDEVLRAIEKIKESDFLQGKKNNFLIKFDWFVKPNNFPKVLDGNYDNKPDNLTKLDGSTNSYDDDFPGYIQL